MYKEEIIMTIIVLALMVLIIFGATLGVKRQTWLNENCTKIGEISGSSSVGVGIGLNGSTPGKIGYKCNDGLEYWE